MDGRLAWLLVDGDILVIETRNFSDKTSFGDTVTTGMGTGQSLRLTERLRRVDADTLEYQFTVDDPATFIRPFTAVLPMRKNAEPLFEYACHEGNYGLTAISSGARIQEQAAQIDAK